MTGKFVKMGQKLGTTYPEIASATNTLIDDFYRMQYDQFKKSAGFAGYGDNGYFNAIMGREITAAMYACDNAFTAIGARPYTHEGMRIALELASYGLGSDGNFLGLGATTAPDGDVPESVKMDVGEYRQPYKELPYAFDYGLGLKALESKEDDTIAYKDYIDKMTANYSNEIDLALLRPISGKQPLVGAIETSLNSISRCTSAYSEIGKTVNGETITANQVCPYGGTSGDFKARAEKESNLDSHVHNLNGGTLGIQDMRKLWRDVSANWRNGAAPNNKMWLMSNIAQDKLGAIMAANNYYLESVYVQRDFNGVRTVPGRDAGFVLNSYQNIPIVQDNNLNFNFTNKKVSTVKYGPIHLLDLDHIWMRMLTPVEFQSVDNYAITRTLRERNVMLSRMETGIDMFIVHGRLEGIADETA